MLGEMALLEMLRPHLAVAGGQGLHLGAGDDSALWRPATGAMVAVTTDTLVEDIHFRRPRGAGGWRDLGWKLLAISLSDLAAMAAAPGPAFISLSLPGDWEAAWVTGLYEGLAEASATFGACLAGGNITASATAVLTSTCLGEVGHEAALTRVGAQPGWSLAVTGEVGGSAAALHAERPEDAWLRRLHRPQPRLDEARLAAQRGVRVAIDVSDGLFADAGRLLGSGASGLVLDADAIPTAGGLRQAWPQDWLDVAGGGEDYELLLAGPAPVMASAVAAIAPATIIGRFDGGDGVRVVIDGVERPAPVVGHQHFR